MVSVPLPPLRHTGPVRGPPFLPCGPWAPLTVEAPRCGGAVLGSAGGGDLCPSGNCCSSPNGGSRGVSWGGRVPHGWSAWAGAHAEIPAASEHPPVLAALGEQPRRAVMQNISRSPTQPSRMTCEAPSGSRGKSYATCISFPRSTAVSAGLSAGGTGSAGARGDAEGGPVRGVGAACLRQYRIIQCLLTKAVGHESQKIL